MPEVIHERPAIRCPVCTRERGSDEAYYAFRINTDSKATLDAKLCWSTQTNDPLCVKPSRRKLSFTPRMMGH
jgi:hypothetical protein